MRHIHRRTQAELPRTSQASEAHSEQNSSDCHRWSARACSTSYRGSGIHGTSGHDPTDAMVRRTFMTKLQAWGARYFTRSVFTGGTPAGTLALLVDVDL